MDMRFKKEELDRLETATEFSAGYEKGIVVAHRKWMQAARAVRDERDLYAVIIGREHSSESRIAISP